MSNRRKALHRSVSRESQEFSCAGTNGRRANPIRCGRGIRVLVLALSVAGVGVTPASVQGDATASRGEQSTDARAGKAFEVTVNANRVSLRAEGVPLGTVMQAISSGTGLVAHLRGDTASRPIHLRFTDLRLDVALRRLLAGTSYSLVYLQPGDPARVKEVYVLANLPPPTPRPAAPIPAAASEPTRLPPVVREALAEARRNLAQANAEPGKLEARKERLVELLREALKGDPKQSIAERFRARLRDARESIR